MIATNIRVRSAPNEWDERNPPIDEILPWTVETDDPWEAIFPPETLPVIFRCLRRILSWRLPPNWSRFDWREEVREILGVSAWSAQSEFDPTRGIPFPAFLHQRLMARALTRYRQEWTYGLRFHSRCSESPTSDDEDRADPGDVPDTVDPFSGVEDSPEREALAEAVAALPEPSRRLMMRLFWEERPEREVAAELGISQPAVSKRKQAIMRELHRSLDARTAANLAASPKPVCSAPVAKVVPPSFPGTLKEFRQRFSQERACFQYLAQCRWPEGFICPHCGGRACWIKARHFECKCQTCGHQTSPTAGTILHRSHVALREWFRAAWLLSAHTPGMSAIELQHQMRCSYKTAWLLLHRLRQAVHDRPRSILHGCVEAGAVMLGGHATVKAGHAVAVMGAEEIIVTANDRGASREEGGRLRLSATAGIDAESVRRFLSENVEPGTELHTDGWRRRFQSALSGYREALPHRDKHLVDLHRAFGELQAWLNGTHHGVDPNYLQTYLDEFVFRFNRHHDPMAAFHTLLGLAATHPPEPCGNVKLGASTG